MQWTNLHGRLVRHFGAGEDWIGFHRMVWFRHGFLGRLEECLVLCRVHLSQRCHSSVDDRRCALRTCPPTVDQKAMSHSFSAIGRNSLLNSVPIHLDEYLHTKMWLSTKRRRGGRLYSGPLTSAWYLPRCSTAGQGGGQVGRSPLRSSLAGLKCSWHLHSNFQQ